MLVYELRHKSTGEINRELRLLELEFQLAERTPLPSATKDHGAARRAAMLARRQFPDKLAALRGWVERGGVVPMAYQNATRDLSELIQEARGEQVANRRECTILPSS